MVPVSILLQQTGCLPGTEEDIPAGAEPEVFDAEGLKGGQYAEYPSLLHQGNFRRVHGFVENEGQIHPSAGGVPDSFIPGNTSGLMIRQNKIAFTAVRLFILLPEGFIHGGPELPEKQDALISSKLKFCQSVSVLGHSVSPGTGLDGVALTDKSLNLLPDGYTADAETAAEFLSRVPAG